MNDPAIVEPLPEPDVWRVTWVGQPGWSQYHDKGDPMPKEWGDEPPHEVEGFYSGEQMRAAMNKEREAAAQACEAWGAMHKDTSPMLEQTADCCAAAIRARSSVAVHGRTFSEPPHVAADSVHVVNGVIVGKRSISEVMKPNILPSDFGVPEKYNQEAQAFADRMVSKEREECAQLAESDEFYGNATQHLIAHAIRVRK